ncbi:sensor domain-containing diguanylate cyclase [Rhodoferax sp. GW822-FHT02A01]|uniref:sensor domain-containing diguanylate cyclase n=1 Tax=Rhodoferax sp. GW822-FHT02A01 TaxID=3141537 RepID=UPI00315CD297
MKALLPKPEWASYYELVYWLVGLFLVSLWCFVGFWSWWERSSVLAATTLELEQLTAAVQVQTKGLFKQAETSLVAASHWIANHPNEDPAKTAEFIDLVDQLRKTSEGLLDLRMVTHTGLLRYIPDQGQTRQTNVSDRDYFQAQMVPATRGLFIANPVLSRVTNKWGIPISVPVEKGGADTAVLFVAIELERIAATFESERPKPNGTIAILKADGTIMFRSPMEGKVVGNSIAKSDSWVQHLSVFPKGSYLSPESPFDGVARIVSYSRVPGYPLQVSATQSKDDVLTAWRLHTLILSVVALVVSLFCLLLGKALISALNSEEDAHSELERLMLTDSLTGIGNRRMLTRWLEEEILRAHRYDRALTVVFIDLDHFKGINDTYGHSVGDEVLVDVAECIRSQLRQSDHVGRYGGEEFVVLLVETTLAEALPLVERMRSAVGGLKIPKIGEPITVSAGIAQLQAGEAAGSLLQRSDKALYLAKASGRNKTCTADGL